MLSATKLLYNDAAYTFHILKPRGPTHENSCKRGPSFPWLPALASFQHLGPGFPPPAAGSHPDQAGFPQAPASSRRTSGVWNDIRKTTGLISILPFYYYRFWSITRSQLPSVCGKAQTELHLDFI
uniref:Uncharacterized protein n=1 Tax=Myotis myotis TaxID=51298 RepID=A0A7J8AMD0_MYOMY|nr:hypothetical protein mMyoMyo1_007929 [Myotis myotis]